MLEVIPFDPTGKAPSNLIQQEIHVITKQNYRDYHYIVPTFAPFFSETSYDGVDTPVKLTIKLLDNTVKELSEGIDYVFTHKFVTASRSIALSDVVGSITFMDNELAGVVTIDKYQALGGEWLVTNDEISKILMETAINPRITSWEAVAGRPTTFPVINHDYDIINLKGYTNTGIAMVAARFTKSFMYNEHTILPMSAVLEGEYGLSDVALSIPRMICADGIVRSFAPHLPKEELDLLYASAESVKKAIASAKE